MQGFFVGEQCDALILMFKTANNAVHCFAATLGRIAYGFQLLQRGVFLGRVECH